MTYEEKFIKHIENNDFNNVVLFLNDNKVKANFDNDYPIILASSLGFINLVRLFLTYEEVNPSARCNSPISCATERGFFDIVKLLLNDKRIDKNLNSAVVLACIRGHFNIYNLFLQYNFDPSSCENSCIRSVNLYHEDTKMLNLLWKDERIKNSLKNDDLKLYNKLIKEDVKEKINSF